jgi:hypothetical protein
MSNNYPLNHSITVDFSSSRGHKELVSRTRGQDLRKPNTYFITMAWICIVQIYLPSKRERKGARERESKKT